MLLFSWRADGDRSLTNVAVSPRETADVNFDKLTFLS